MPNKKTGCAKLSAFAVLVCIILCGIVLSCKHEPPQNEKNSQFKSIHEIPGVTPEEITAISALSAKKPSFVYGTTSNTEAFSDENGNIGGFTVLLCDWLSELFGIRFVPKILTWGNLITGLQAHEIDFTGELTPTEERRKTWFMTDAIAERQIKHFRIAGSPPLSEIAMSRPVRYIFLEDTTTVDAVMPTLHPSAEIIYIDNNQRAYELLKNGRADTFINEGPGEASFDIYGDVVTSDFFPLVFEPVALSTHNPDLEPIISVVQKMLRNGGIQYLTELYNQGYYDYKKHKLFAWLNEEELAYIHKKPVVEYAAEHDNYPVSFYNEREKQWQGVAADMLKEIESLTGITFKRVNDQAKDFPDLLKMLEDGKVSMITHLIRTHEREGKFLWPATSLFSSNYALLSKTEHRNININEILYVKVGLMKDTAYAAVFRTWFPTHSNTIEYENETMAFNALADGKVDMVMTLQSRLLDLLNYRERVGYKTNIIFDESFGSTFGFNKDEIILCAIVDKALQLIDTKGVSGRWLQKTYDYRVKVIEAQLPWFIGAAVLLLAVLSLILIMFLRSRNEGKRLEDLVNKRTNELNKSQHELEDALEIAKRANSSKSIFLANMSHEIRTPMNSIIGFSELAMDGETSPKTKDYLDKIRTNAGWLLQIINDILDISKIESGKMELENIPFDMHELFVSCRTLVMPKAVEKGVMLHFYAEPSLGKKPVGDPTRLRQVIVNLLSNAIKFTNSGMVKLLADIIEVRDNTATVNFEVKDSGIGMTSEQIAKIFDPFTQAETGTTRKYGGTGLGLAITKNMVELMGGKISVESTPGVGSKFSFKLKFNTINITEEEAFAKQTTLKQIEKPEFDAEVLLFEDNEMNQQVISEHLSRVGIKTVIAENGKIGVDILSERKRNNEKQFDLIFMDMHMPVMDGLEASAKILELDIGVPVVAMTANIMSDDKEIYKSHGMNDCVGKPFTSQELWRCLLKYLKQKEYKTGSASPNPEQDTTDNVIGDPEFQKQMQILFVRSNRNKHEEIIKALKDNDLKLAHRLAHSLKGNAGQFGKSSLQKAAADIEHHLKGETNLVTSEHLEILKMELALVINELSEILETVSSTEVQSEPYDEETAKKTLEKLGPLLEMGSPDSLNFTAGLRSIPGSEKLIQQIEDFDFEKAVTALADLKKELKI
ncbi:MAG: transporter substrate-binding domain-containing protein [Treponema sp.]|jgi:signal transduction histidine kinase/DNA-binding response OmpR family regulator|nr:transporter substrate-binding domain-containing protein [Treponema sp.]